MLGTDFPYQQFYPDNAKVIQVDIRGRNLGRRTPIDLGLVGTVKDTLAALQPLLRQKTQRDHLDDRCATIARPARRLTSWRSTIATAPRSGRNTLRDLPISWQQTTRSSPSTSVRRWCGPPDT